MDMQSFAETKERVFSALEKSVSGDSLVGITIEEK
jgi:hypothetical protein